ncbi:PfkB family carbohydrate kinase [Herbiconiux sp. CPCC 203407]|uniref:PfkB family carbohydrate kinase n=1 Tax=Herbiconiux oxytropis TaxID=2970915 RepID=A0AA42BWH3_9MICO|nr:PfkB family carbohydrate kinase [Herbiconiux oxytropis]MCS5720570.1 PfkB family carbohydrate kinase [Herbiconiux oxytropis]MCS5726143.1 PfkB family carbohydrate kinase [Herbiconiux oxytropis]
MGSRATAPASRSLTPGGVVVFGDVIDDVIVTPAHEIRPDTDTTASIERRPGGSAANAAAWFAHLGERTDFFGRVGVAEVEQHAALLEQHGVRAHLVGDPERPTGTIVIILEQDRTRTMLTERGANALTSGADLDRALIGPGTHLHFTAYTIFSEALDGSDPAERYSLLIREMQAAGATVSVNPGSAGFIADHGAGRLRAAMAGADVLIPNLDEGRMLTGRHEPDAVVEALLAEHPLVALTLGRDGVLAARRSGERVRVPALQLTPVDTTGAGDAFSAGFVCGLRSTGGVQHGDLRAAAEAGVRTAAEAVGRVGARPVPGVSPASVRAAPVPAAS